MRHRAAPVCRRAARPVALVLLLLAAACDPPEPPPRPRATGVLAWDPPETRPDGTCLEEPVRYRVRFARAGEADRVVETEIPRLPLEDVWLTEGRWTVTVTAVDAAGRESRPSGSVEVVARRPDASPASSGEP